MNRVTARFPEDRLFSTVSYAAIGEHVFTISGPRHSVRYWTKIARSTVETREERNEMDQALKILKEKR